MLYGINFRDLQVLNKIFRYLGETPLISKHIYDAGKKTDLTNLQCEKGIIIVYYIGESIGLSLYTGKHRWTTTSSACQQLLWIQMG